MKATGVVRKVDHLGRIVIPKELRKNLNIKDDENLEIFVEDDVILLKKVSSLSGVEDFAKKFVEIIPSLLEKNLIITDMSNVIACNKEISDLYFHQELTFEYLEVLNKREIFVSSSPSKISMLSVNIPDSYYMLVPIIVQGDLLGSLFLFSESKEIENKDKILLKFVLNFLEKNLEA